MHSWRSIFAALALLAMVAAALPATVRAAQDIPTENVEAIEKIVREYLLRNPEVLLEAMEVLEKRREEIAQARRREALVASRSELLEDNNSFTVGAADADVTVVEFFDYRCPYCKRVVATVAATIENDPKVRFVFKEFPILGEDSVLASRAAIASIAQGKYPEYHEALMATRGTLNEAAVMQIAAEVGLDTDRLRQDMIRPEISRIIAANHELAKRLGITGTPAFVVGDTIVPGAISLRQMISLIDQARAPTD